MARFHFHLYGEEATLDFEGREFPDLAAACTEAVGNARELMATDLASTGEINLRHRIELEDDDGEIVIVNFRDAVTIRP